MRNTRKYIILAVALLLTATVHAQVFIMTEEDYENSARAKLPDHTQPWIPIQGLDQDQSLYGPVGNGLWLLGCLGGAYLLGKRRKKDEE